MSMSSSNDIPLALSQYNKTNKCCIFEIFIYRYRAFRIIFLLFWRVNFWRVQKHDSDADAAAFGGAER